MTSRLVLLRWQIVFCIYTWSWFHSVSIPSWIIPCKFIQCKISEYMKNHSLTSLNVAFLWTSCHGFFSKYIQDIRSIQCQSNSVICDKLHFSYSGSLWIPNQFHSTWRSMILFLDVMGFFCCCFFLSLNYKPELISIQFHLNPVSFHFNFIPCFKNLPKKDPITFEISKIDMNIFLIRFFLALCMNLLQSCRNSD